MPTYRNSTSVDITVGAFRFPGRTTMEITSYLEGALPAGLAWISDAPNPNPVILAQKYALKTGTDLAAITVGSSDTKGYFISFYVESGEFQVTLNGPMVMVYPSSAAATPPILVTEGQTWGRKYVSRVIESINIHCVIGGTIYVNIYKL